MNELQFKEWATNLQIGDKVQWVVESVSGKETTLIAKFGEICEFKPSGDIIVVAEEGDSLIISREELCPPEYEPLKEFTLGLIKAWDLSVYE